MKNETKTPWGFPRIGELSCMLSYTHLAEIIQKGVLGVALVR